MNSAVSDAFARMQIKIAGVARLKKVLHGLPGKSFLIFIKKNSLSR